MDEMNADELLREVARSGVSFDDARVDYVEVQISRDTWDAIRSGKSIPSASEPSEPTPAMQQAGVRELRNAYWTGTDYARVCAIWRAMVEARIPSSFKEGCDRDSVIEECAKACDGAKEQMRFGDMERAAEICAAMIRALKNAAPQERHPAEAGRDLKAPAVAAPIVPSSEKVSGNALFLCIASGEGSHDARVCADKDGVAAFYEEMFGRDMDDTITSFGRSWDDPDEWSNEGTAFSMELYCATFHVWKVPASQLSVPSARE